MFCENTNCTVFLFLMTQKGSLFAWCLCSHVYGHACVMTHVWSLGSSLGSRPLTLILFETESLVYELLCPLGQQPPAQPWSCLCLWSHWRSIRLLRPDLLGLHSASVLPTEPAPWPSHFWYRKHTVCLAQFSDSFLFQYTGVSHNYGPFQKRNVQRSSLSLYPNEESVAIKWSTRPIIHSETE